MVTYDVAIVGGGIIGAAIAAELSKRGRKVALLDKQRAASGTSAHCEGNLLVSDKGPGPELELAKLANAAWTELNDSYRTELGESFPSIEFERKGGLVVATSEPGAENLQGFAAKQRAANIHAEEISIDQARKLEPWITPRLTAAVWYPEDSQIQPTIATEALLNLARKRGADILEYRNVTAPIRHGDRITGVKTSQGDVHADSVVVAAGPWSGHVAGALGRVEQVRQVPMDSCSGLAPDLTE